LAHTTRPGLCCGVCFTLIIAGRGCSVGWVKSGTNPSLGVRQGRMCPAGTGLPFDAEQGRLMLEVGCEPVDLNASYHG